MTFNNFIDGAWVPSRYGRLFENRNPADRDDLIGSFQESAPPDVEDALAAAARAYTSWRLVPAPRRAEILFRAAQIIADRKEAFARDMTREMGKVLEETRGDVQEAIDMTYFMAGEGPSWRARGAASTGRPSHPSCATSSPCRCASRWASAR